jgi:hypothetical protein
MNYLEYAQFRTETLKVPTAGLKWLRDAENDLRQMEVKRWRQNVENNGYMSQKKPRFLVDHRVSK